MLTRFVISVDDELELVHPPDLEFPSFCIDAAAISSSSSTTNPIFVGLSSSGKLLVAGRLTPLSDHVTSFTLTPAYIVYTSSAHEAHFIPIDSLSNPSSGDPERRRVERGSRIVVAIPSTMSLVLQMPRGNLETISPRPFVLDIVKADVTRFAYTLLFLKITLGHSFECITASAIGRHF